MPSAKNTPSPAEEPIRLKEQFTATKQLLNRVFEPVYFLFFSIVAFATRAAHRSMVRLTRHHGHAIQGDGNGSKGRGRITVAHRLKTTLCFCSGWQALKRAQNRRRFRLQGTGCRVPEQLPVVS
jgi:hypothetical protein